MASERAQDKQKEIALGLPHGARIADIGCGSGVFSAGKKTP
jgi:ribosomal protein L11 methylase PrmA